METIKVNKNENDKNENVDDKENNGEDKKYRVFYGDKDKPVLELPYNEAVKIANETINELPFTKSNEYLKIYENKTDEMVVSFDKERFDKIMKDEKFLIIGDRYCNIRSFTFEGFGDCNVGVVFLGEEMNVEDINGDAIIILAEEMKKLDVVECCEFQIYNIQPNLSMLFCMNKLSDEEIEMMPELRIIG